MKNQIIVTVEYLPSSRNVKVDRGPRNVGPSQNGNSDQKYFINPPPKILGQLKINLFVSPTHQLVLYIARKPDPNSTATDTIHQKWNKNLTYVFHPFCFLNQIFNKVLSKRTNTKP